MGSFWDNTDFKSGNTYAEWNEEGDTVQGAVVALDVHTFEANERGPERVVPKVTVDVGNGELIEVTCGPADLKKKMLKAAPEIGDRIRIEYVSSNKTAVGLQRFFTVKVQRPEPPQTRAEAIPDTRPYGQGGRGSRVIQVPVEDEEPPF